MRSRWKAPFFNFKVHSQLKSTESQGRNRVLKLNHRLIIIDSSMVTRFFSIPNGRGKVKISIKPNIVGHRIGEFIFTRRHVHHYRKKRQKAIEKRRKEEAKKAGRTRIVDTAKIAAIRQKRKSRK